MKVSMLTTAAVLLLGSAVAVSASALDRLPRDLPIPAGWRLANRDEMYPLVREAYPKGVFVRGDFDGDGRKDVALFLVNESRRESCVLVFLARHRGFDLRQIDKGGIGSCSIWPVKPRRYRTLCGQGYSTCAKDEPDHITIKYDAINLNIGGAADVFYYWDSKTASFKSIQMSD